jgi:hypothetical protein
MRFDRFGPVESRPRDEELYYALLRKKSPAEKFRMVVAHMELGRRLKQIGDEIRDRAKTNGP